MKPLAIDIQGWVVLRVSRAMIADLATLTEADPEAVRRATGGRFNR